MTDSAGRQVGFIALLWGISKSFLFGAGVVLVVGSVFFVLYGFVFYGADAAVWGAGALVNDPAIRAPILRAAFLAGAALAITRAVGRGP